MYLRYISGEALIQIVLFEFSIVKIISWLNLDGNSIFQNSTDNSYKSLALTDFNFKTFACKF